MNSDSGLWNIRGNSLWAPLKRGRRFLWHWVSLTNAPMVRNDHTTRCPLSLSFFVFSLSFYFPIHTGVSASATLSSASICEELCASDLVRLPDLCCQISVHNKTGLFSLSQIPLCLFHFLQSIEGAFWPFRLHLGLGLLQSHIQPFLIYVGLDVYPPFVQGQMFPAPGRQWQRYLSLLKVQRYICLV